jgi:hypothetical protein
MDRSAKTEYLHWSQAGGPNECEHGYAEGIPCPNCDANPRIVELRAEKASLELLLRNNQERREEVEMRHGDLVRENERLRTELRGFICEECLKPLGRAKCR